MPLINLQTNLKSLKYGADRPGGGNSGLPYIKTDINTVDRGFNRLRLTKFDDGLVRGGFIGALNASVVDTLRIGKFLTDFPKGPLFIVKQVGLQLSNPKLEAKQSLRTNRTGIFGAVVNLANRISNEVGPTRIYNLGLNTLAQIPVNAFGGHFNRHGLLPVQNEDTKYLSVVQFNNENGSNRLLGLTSKFKLGNPKGTVEINTTTNKVRNFLGRLATTLGINIRGLKPEQLVIDEYKGGPGSVYGILGSTTINRTFQITNDTKRIKDANTWSTEYAGKTRDDNGAPVSVNYSGKLGGGTNGIVNYDFGDGKAPFGDTSIAAGVNQNAVDYSLPTSNNPSLKTYSALKKQIEKQTIASSELGFPGTQNNIDLNREAKNYKYYSGKLTEDSTLFNRTYDIKEAKNDQFPVVFAPINPFTPGDFKGKPIYFLAYLNNYDESYDSTWNEINYVGRAESFYIFNRFKRTTNIDLTIPCFNETQLTENHNKLFKLGGGGLAYSLAGQYNGNNLLGGVITRVTIGNYLKNTPGIITGLRFNIIDSSPWDMKKLYAQYIKCTFNFTVIGDYLPQYQKTLSSETTKGLGSTIGRGIQT